MHDQHGDGSKQDSESRLPIGYLQRIRDYYLALGYETPYDWARFSEVPFSGMAVPVNKARIGIVTTAARYNPVFGDQGPGATYNAAAKFYTVYTDSTAGAVDLRISHIGYDRCHTHARDMRCWFPLQQLRCALEGGEIGSISPRYYGLPTNRSQTTTMDRDCPALLSCMQEDSVDAALLVANCPVCHQCCSLAARHLEAAGIPTVVMGCARDIVEHIGVPRFLFSDLPLGNAAGKPFDDASQHTTLALALTLLGDAAAPRITRQSPVEWSGDHRWKQDFYNISNLSSEQIAERRQAFDQQKMKARSNRQKEGLVEDPGIDLVKER